MRIRRRFGLRAGVLLLGCGLGWSGAGPGGGPAAQPIAAPGPRVLASGATPARLSGLIAAAGTSDDHDGADVVTVFDSTRVVVEDSGLSHRRQRTLRKALTPEGALALGSLRCDYDPASNTIEILGVRVHRADSSCVEIDPALAVDAAAPAHMIYWGARMKVLELPRIEVGDAVEVETEKMGFQIAYLAEYDEDLERYIPPMRGHFYDVVLFQKPEPLKHIHYELVLPREKPAQYSVYNGEIRSALAFTDSTLVYRWWLDDQPAIEYEPFEPDASDFVTKIVLATVPDWPEKSRWFHEVNDPVFAWNDEIAEKVAELTRGLKSDEERMAALLHWVADNIRYSGLSMGEGEGYTIHPGIMTWEDRCGVCKDIAGMLVTMLRAAGYTTYPVMTMAGARVETIPADQFNHCVVAVPRPGGGFVMLDPTWAPLSRQIWSHAEGEQHYVIGSPEGEDLSAIRSFAPEENLLAVRFRTTLAEDGELRGEVTLEGSGYMDARLRNGLAAWAEPEWHVYAARALSGISPVVEVTESEFGDYQDYGRPMRMRLGFRVPGYAAINDSTIDLALPSARFLAGSRRFLRIIDLPAVEERRHPALFWATGTIEVAEELRLPERVSWRGELPSQDLDREAAAYRASVRTGDGDGAGRGAAGTPRGEALSVDQKLVLKRRTVPPEEWDGIAAVSDSLKSFASARLHAVR